MKRLIRSGIFLEDIDRFVEEGLLHLDRCKSFDTFKAIVSIKSTISPSIVDIMRSYLMEHMSGLTFSITLLKKMYKDVQFDSDKARATMLASGRYTENDIDKEINYTLIKFEELKITNEFFKIHRFLPREVRGGFSDFLIFGSEDEKRVYQSIQGVDVLIYDDLYTSGSSILETMRILNSVNPNNTLTVFVLIKQH